MNGAVDSGRSGRTRGPGRSSAIALAFLLVAATALIAGCGGATDEADLLQDVTSTEDETPDTSTGAAGEGEISIADAEAARRQKQEAAALAEGYLPVTGSEAAPPPEAELGDYVFRSYRSEEGAWSAQVPFGGEWEKGTEAWLNPGLHRTTFNGPSGTLLIVDSTPEEKPAFNGAGERTAIDHPRYSGVEKIIMSSDSSLSACQTTKCVDFLVPLGDIGGGFGILAGGPANFDELQDIAATVLDTIEPAGGL